MGQVCRDGIRGTACLDVSGISGVQTVLTLPELLELPGILAAASTLEGREMGSLAGATIPEGRGNEVINRCQHTRG